MQYMFLIYSEPGAGPEMGSDEHQAEMQQWFAYTAALGEAGVLVRGDALHGTEAATTVRVRDGGALHTDGPFAETKEALGGYYLVDVPTLDDALAWAAKVPNAGYGSIEVRPVVDFSQG
jgi:hypothetical protein